MQRDAQRQVYELLAPKLYASCKRYLKKEEEIEEALADAFFTIFTKLDQLKEIGAFEAWARKIAVNHCLATIKKKTNFNMYLDDVKTIELPYTDEDTHLEENDLLELLNQIPDGCKTVFNLFVIEGYGHKEIAKMLQISEGTSKSQLNAAKTKLKELVNKMYYKKSN
ncbi:RNA polymerase subunit sigma-24 [Flavobacterium faecale]|uniref:RNA polymerase subunit sigma-24 n=1 Tax=Flavobacterium faecale TaxID=1355330 RepID=A0A2S1LJ21_9FLAO|nr:sigma-70 family RNA polymerase sigma factor [Flavobacterium faecale]AWG23486.1 RNA polymerase subunit sigma-24 [Flavobacterium faecale]